MSRWAALAAVLAVLALAEAVFAYRARKLAALEPRILEISTVKSGQTGAGCTLLMIGDSHIARWRVTPPSGWHVDQVGFPGETAINIADALPEALRRSVPDAVLIAAGTNDASAAALQGDGRNRTVDRAARAVERMIVAAQAAGTKRVMVATLPPPHNPQLWRQLIYGRRQAAALASLADGLAALAGTRGAKLFDVDALTRDAKGMVRGELRADTLHLSPAGYEVLSAALWRDLGECRGEER